MSVNDKVVEFPPGDCILTGCLKRTEPSETQVNLVTSPSPLNTLPAPALFGCQHRGDSCVNIFTFSDMKTTSFYFPASLLDCGDFSLHR